MRIREDTKRQNVEVENHLNITQDALIKQIAEKENMNVATVRRLFQSTEDIIFHYLSSTDPSEELTIKLRNVPKYRLPGTCKYKSTFIKILQQADQSKIIP